MELIEKIKQNIKQKDPKLYSKIMDAKISDKEILFKANVIFQYLDKVELDNEYKYSLEIKDNKIFEVIVPDSLSTKKQELLKELKRPFLYGYNSEDMYFWDGKKIDWNANERMQIYHWATKVKQSGYINNGLWIWGPQGTGKTAAVVAILNGFAKSKLTVAFVAMSDFVINMQNAAVKDGVYTDELLNPIKQAKVLVFDDMGAERMTEWARDALFVNILDYRINNKLLTIFTSNVNLNDYYKKIDFGKGKKSVEAARVIDRISELAPTQVHITGKSFRGKLKKTDLLMNIKK